MELSKSLPILLLISLPCFFSSTVEATFWLPNIIPRILSRTKSISVFNYSPFDDTPAPGPTPFLRGKAEARVQSHIPFPGAPAPAHSGQKEASFSVLGLSRKPEVSGVFDLSQEKVSTQSHLPFPRANDLPDPLELPKISPASVNPHLRAICADTDHPLECLGAVVPQLYPHSSISASSVLEVAVKTTSLKAKEALSVAQKLKSQPITKHFSSAIDTCIDNYKSILDTNQKTLDAISASDIYSLNSELSANIDNLDSCKDAFYEAGIPSPLSHFDHLLGKMVSNNLAIGVERVHF